MDSLRCRCFSRLASKISNACAAVLMAGSSHHPADSGGHQLLLECAMFVGSKCARCDVFH
jgi:hypothetical protein